MHHLDFLQMFALFKAQYNSSTQVLAVFFALNLGVAIANLQLKRLRETPFFTSPLPQLVSLLATFLLLLLLIWMLAIVSVWGIVVAIALGMAINCAVRLSN